LLLEGSVSIRSAKRCGTGSIWRNRLTSICLLFLFPAGFAFADTEQYCAVFCGARDQLQNTRLTPIRQLEDETLFQSAAAMREQVMPMEQRLLNQFWLHDTAATRIQGGRVWSRLLRHSLAQLRHKKQKTHEKALDLFDYDDGSTDKSEYRLRLSDDTIRLMIHYNF
jgi:hypothetical protein